MADPTPAPARRRFERRPRRKPPSRLAPAFAHRDDRVPEFDARETGAAVAGGLAGGFQAALVIQPYDTDAIRRIGATFGVPTPERRLARDVRARVLFALPFSVFVSSSIDAFVSKVMLLKSQRVPPETPRPAAQAIRAHDDDARARQRLRVVVGVVLSSFWCPSG